MEKFLFKNTQVECTSFPIVIKLASEFKMKEEKFEMKWDKGTESKSFIKFYRISIWIKIN